MGVFDRVRQDLRFGLRSLGHTPSVTAIAVLSLALGIMATTAMYSVIHAVVLDPFPYREVGRLTSVRVSDPRATGGRISYSTDQFLELAERSTIFEGVIASTVSDVVWTGEGEPQRLRGNYVTTNTFEVMGVPPLLGRAAEPSDGVPGAPEIAVLGYRFWQRQMGGDPSVVGRTLRLNGTVRTVVGVMPKRFMWRGADVYLPVTFARGRPVEGVRLVHLLGRLKPGVTAAQAEGDLRPIVADLVHREPGEFPETWRVGLLSFEETFPSDIREALWLLFGGVVLLLLISCANVSSLLLSRAAAREREIAVRAALGADRRRLVAQLLTEGLILAAAGGLIGTLLAFAALPGILALVPPNTIPDESEVVVNVSVLAFTLAVSVATALVFGLAPALHGSRTDLARPLKAAGRGLGAGAGAKRLRRGLVVAEVALSLMLLVAATLMVRTLAAMQGTDLGIRTDRVLIVRVPLSERRHPEPADRVAVIRDLVRRLGALPGVAAVGVNLRPHPFGNWIVPVEVDGSDRADTRPVLLHQVSAGYTRTLGIALRRGRELEEADEAGGRHVALVNEAFARRHSPDREVVGRAIRLPRLRRAPFTLADDAFEVVGVVGDTVNRNFADEVSPEIYLPHSLAGLADTFVIRTSVPPATLVGPVRATVAEVDREQPVTDVRTMAAALEDAVYSRPRFNLVLFSAFGAIGLVLAAIGVYGVLSNAVAQQRQEIGVRMALGASFGDIARMVMGSGLRLVLAGIAIGLAGSLAGARLLAGQVWRISPFDPASFAAVSLVLLAVGMQACFWPARRAARADAVVALRAD
jgi:predicted permease